MCGIAGYLDLDGAPAATPVVRRMTDAVAHRGPDGEGIWIGGPVGLGHRRLAVIDLSDGGRQPMQTEDGRWTIVYNGELYNYAELKTELSALGIRFRSSSDTEVVLKALAYWGLDALRRFNGMFAFALWDAVEHRLHLARDRFGIKPLYWALAGRTLLFGSEIKALLAHPRMEAALDLGALREYLTFQNFLSERTLFKGVSLLAPGTVVSWRMGETVSPTPRRYHSLAFSEPDTERSEDDLAAELDHLFRQAVSRQLVADVELGAYLSGGIDSGAIAAVASSAIPHLRTFTCGFDLSSASGVELVFDERRDAEMMAARFGTEHYEMVLKAGDMERIIPKLVWHLEEPRVGQCYPNFYIAGLASKFNKVVLAGTGGDEIFGGYAWRYLSAYGATPDALEANAFRTWQRLIPPDLAPAALAPLRGAGDGGPEPFELFRSLLPETGPRATPAERIHALMTFEANSFLRGLLAVDDKVSMAHGLEARVPFLDNDLAEFGSRLAMRHKLAPLPGDGGPMAPGHRRSNEGKRLLRRVAGNFVPAEVASREKQGFSAPDASWFKGQSIDYVRRRLGTPKARIFQLLDRPTIDGLLGQHFAGQHNHRLLIWSLIYLEQALETWDLA
ncbi:MAG: asparagine synthase (glutamine-hydrolyzing) [Mesorhizobium amorphae]|nr:MAG: asparagine synthase (glutamine-hydrolyzing) [Mesorhizobium amorphae]